MTLDRRQQHLAGAAKRIADAEAFDLATHRKQTHLDRLRQLRDSGGLVSRGAKDLLAKLEAELEADPKTD